MRTALLTMVLVVCTLAPPGRAQLLPFSTLHSYFKSASASPAPDAADAAPRPRPLPPANHRLPDAAGDEAEAEAAPVVGLFRPHGRVHAFPSQEAAESGFAGVAAGAAGSSSSSDRVEFQMHGQHGPHSYKWGYDTGKGHNRQFRYEERDALGHVKGHYGFYDKQGKLQVVSYSADPEHGYHADGNFGKHGIA